MRQGRQVVSYWRERDAPRSLCADGWTQAKRSSPENMMPALRDVRFLLLPVAVVAAWHLREDPERTYVAASHSAAPSPRRPPALVGTWRVTKFCTDDSSGHLSEPYGPHPTGYFVYAPSGTLSIQAMRIPPVRPFVGGDKERCSRTSCGANHGP